LSSSGKVILLEGSHESPLLFVGLEATVSELGRGVDPFEVGLLQSLPLHVGDERLSQGQDTLLWSDAATVEHDEVVLHFTVVRESTHWVDALISDVGFGGTVVLDQFTAFLVDGSSDPVHFLVDFSPVMVTFLTGTSHGVHDTSRMPSSDTSDFAETFVGFPWEFLGSPTAGDTLFSVTLVDSDDVNHLVLGENVADWNLFLQKFPGVCDLLGDVSTVHLDFHQVSLLQLKWEKFWLSVCDDTDDLAEFCNLLEVMVDLLLSVFVRPHLGRLGESLLLGVVPVLVETTTALLAEMLSKDGLEGPETSGGFDVTNDTDNYHWWGLNNGDSSGDFTLVGL